MKLVNVLVILCFCGIANAFQVKIEVENWPKREQKVLLGYWREDSVNLPVVTKISSSGKTQFALPNRLPEVYFDTPPFSSNLLDTIHRLTYCSLDYMKDSLKNIRVYVFNTEGLYVEAKKGFGLSRKTFGDVDNFWIKEHYLIYVDKPINIGRVTKVCYNGKTLVNLNFKLGWNIMYYETFFGRNLDVKNYAGMDGIIKHTFDNYEEGDISYGQVKSLYYKYLK